MNSKFAFAPGIPAADISRHHRKPKSKGGTDSKRNISLLDHKSHMAWHLLFGNKSPEEIASLINKLYLDPDFKFRVERA